MKSFLETQKELARKVMSDIQFLHGVPVELPLNKQRELDDLITQVLANHAKELVRLVEGENIVEDYPTYDEEVKALCLNDDANYNRGLKKAISIINSSGISID